jgi:hypothetical protein
MIKDGAIGNTKMFQYKGTISFESNQELTPKQLNQIVFAIQVQMEEPADEEEAIADDEGIVDWFLGSHCSLVV